MKGTLVIIIVFTANACFGQKNYYLINDHFRNEEQTKTIMDSLDGILKVDKRLLKAVIYHKELKVDSVINYLSFTAIKYETEPAKRSLQISYSQDSLFLLINKQLPEFKLFDLNSSQFSSAELIGKPTMINFWSVNCSPCIAEFPQLNKLKETFVDRVNFIAIAEGTCEVDGVEKMLSRKAFNFYVLKNGDSYKKLLNIKSLPQNLFIDRKGYIRFIRGGLPFEKDLKTGKLIIRSNREFEILIERLLKF